MHKQLYYYMYGLKKMILEMLLSFAFLFFLKVMLFHRFPYLTFWVSRILRRKEGNQIHNKIFFNGMELLNLLKSMFQTPWTFYAGCKS